MSCSNISTFDKEALSIRSILISYEITETILMIDYAIMCLPVCAFGIVTNMINIIIFVKQGLQDTVNISLFGLAISDLIGVVSLFWTSICLVPPFINSDIPFSSLEVQYLTGDWIHLTFARISGCITALIMFERLLCVVSPLKVKTILTPSRIKLSVIIFFVSNVVIVAPVYFAYDLGWKYYPQRNRTLVGLMVKQNREEIEGFSLFLMNLIILPLSIIAVMACALGLVIKLNHQSKWRKKSSSRKGSGNDVASTKDKKVIKMIMTIAAIFIICFLPVFFIVAWMIEEPEYVVAGWYENMYLVTVSIAYVLEAISSSVNIIVYYQMSSRYKATFCLLFGKWLMVE